jgi:uncharacterized protein YbaP (TraB family)
MLSSNIRRQTGAWIVFGSILLANAHWLQAGDISSTGKHCLWLITNAPAPFYLLGSVHALQPSDYSRTPVIEEAISQSQQFLFEFDPKEDEAFAKKLREAARYPRGPADSGKDRSQNLQVLTEDNHQRYERLATSPSLGDSNDPAKSGIRTSQYAIRD